MTSSAREATGPLAQEEESSLPHTLPPMRCVACGQEEPDDGNFCARCGAPLMASNQGTTTFFVPTGGETLTTTPRVSMEDLEAGQAMLVTVRGPTAGRTYVLDGPIVSVGRAPDCD